MASFQRCPESQLELASCSSLQSPGCHMISLPMPISPVDWSVCIYFTALIYLWTLQCRASVLENRHLLTNLGPEGSSFHSLHVTTIAWGFDHYAIFTSRGYAEIDFAAEVACGYFLLNSLLIFTYHSIYSFKVHSLMDFGICTELYNNITINWRINFITILKGPSSNHPNLILHLPPSPLLGYLSTSLNNITSFLGNQFCDLLFFFPISFLFHGFILLFSLILRFSICSIPYYFKCSVFIENLEILKSYS